VKEELIDTKTHIDQIAFSILEWLISNSFAWY
jgi:hypothetical protein